MNSPTGSNQSSRSRILTVQAVVEALEAYAKASEPQTVFYSLFMQHLGLDPDNQQDITVISALLAQASELTYKDPARQFMLPVLVVSEAVGIPGGGFYKLAKKLGAIGPKESREDFFLRQIQLVFDHYGS
jgi:hypothetical protein